MVSACVSGWTWSSGSQDDSPRPRGTGGKADGEEDVRRDRYLGAFRALLCGPVEERAGGQPGAVAEHGAQVRGGGGGCRDRSGRAGRERGAVGGSCPGVVPGTG